MVKNMTDESKFLTFKSAKNGKHLSECIKNDQSFSCQSLGLIYMSASHGMGDALVKVIDGVPYWILKSGEKIPWFEEKQ